MLTSLLVITAGVKAHGISVIGDNSSISNSGSVSITNRDANAINSSGDDASISNSGTISASGTRAFAVHTVGDNTDISNDGSILTTGWEGVGISSTGADVTISNNGTISTSSTRAFAIHTGGDNTGISNSGSILTTGFGALGISSAGTYTTINNSGTVSSLGAQSHVIYAIGDNADISNSGALSAAGPTSSTIILNGADGTISNNGSLSTTGDNGHGIYASGNNADVSNSGSISTAGSGSLGIALNSADASLKNSGTILTTGANSHGVYSIGANADISNGGSISTTGAGALGVALIGADASFNNNGSVSTTGTNAHAVYATGDNAIVNNNGLISATGSGAYAILGDASDSTINLLAGSQLIGNVDLGAGGHDTVNIYAGSQSISLEFLNVEIINLFGVTGFVSGGTVLTVDPTGESSRSVALSGLTRAIHDTVSQRIAHTTPLKPIQVASLTLSPGMLFQERAPVAWAQVFGGNYHHDALDSAMAYGIDHIGFTLGYEWDNENTRVGLLGGVVHSKTKTDMTSFKTQSNSYYVGAYDHFNLEMFNVTTSLLAGYANHTNHRVVNGVEVAKSEMNSFFLSPSLTLSSVYTVADKLEFRPSASINYSMEWLDHYREKGTVSSDLNVDNRTLKVLTAKIQLAAAYQLDQNSELEFRVGMTSRSSDDDDTNVSIAGNSFSYSNAGDENVSGRFAGVNLRLADQNNLTLMVDVEFGGSRDENYVNGEISLAHQF